jgi:hypothetical protein
VKVITLLVGGIVLFGNSLPNVEPHVERLFHIQDSCPCICMDLFAYMCENSNEIYYPFPSQLLEIKL